MRTRVAPEVDDDIADWKQTASKKVPYHERHDGEERVWKVTTMKRVTETVTVTERDEPAVLDWLEPLPVKPPPDEKKQPVVVRKHDEADLCCCRVWPARDYMDEVVRNLQDKLGRAETGASRDVHILSLKGAPRQPTIRELGAHRVAQRIVEPAVERIVHRVQPIDKVVERKVYKKQEKRVVTQYRTKRVARPVERVHWTRTYTQKTIEKPVYVEKVIENVIVREEPRYTRTRTVRREVPKIVEKEVWRDVVEVVPRYQYVRKIIEKEEVYETVVEDKVIKYVDVPEIKTVYMPKVVWVDVVTIRDKIIFEEVERDNHEKVVVKRALAVKKERPIYYDVVKKVERPQYYDVIRRVERVAPYEVVQTFTRKVNVARPDEIIEVKIPVPRERVVEVEAVLEVVTPVVERTVLWYLPTPVETIVEVLVPDTEVEVLWKEHIEYYDAPYDVYREEVVEVVREVEVEIAVPRYVDVERIEYVDQERVVEEIVEVGEKVVLIEHKNVKKVEGDIEVIEQEEVVIKRVEKKVHKPVEVIEERKVVKEVVEEVVTYKDREVEQIEYWVLIDVVDSEWVIVEWDDVEAVEWVDVPTAREVIEYIDVPTPRDAIQYVDVPVAQTVIKEVIEEVSIPGRTIIKRIEEPFDVVKEVVVQKVRQIEVVVESNEDLPTGWGIIYDDEAAGGLYYYNRDTHERSKVRPGAERPCGCANDTTMPVPPPDIAAMCMAASEEALVDTRERHIAEKHEAYTWTMEHLSDEERSARQLADGGSPNARFMGNRRSSFVKDLYE